MSLTRTTFTTDATLPLAVTYVMGDDSGELPATVTRLLKRYFEVEVTRPGGRVETVKLAYRGEPWGAFRPSKAHERRYGIHSPAGVYGQDLQTVRVLSGRSAH